MSRNCLRILTLLPFLLPLFAAAPARACNVPVFRYALERWPADPYRVVVFHRGPLSAADRALAAVLEKHAASNRTPANVEVELADLDRELDRELQELYNVQKQPELPWVVVRYPAAAKNDAVVWAGRLGEGAVGALLDSPARREIAKRVAAGETAVWVLLESGNESLDNAAAGVLQKRLPKLKALLKLPELTDSPADRIAAAGPPLQIAFSMVRVSRANPDEQMLVRMLLHSEDDLADKREPMAFPVFGRGRALWALVGKGITDENIDEAGAFLVGPCSCQVKRLNPGTDLLMTANWDVLIEGRHVKDHPAPPLQGLFAFTPELLPVPPRAVESEAPNMPDGPTRPEKLTFPHAPPPLVIAADGTETNAPVPTAESSLVLLRNIGLAVLAGIGLLAAYALVLRGKSGRAD